MRGKAQSIIYVLHNISMNDFGKSIAAAKGVNFDTEPFAITNISRIIDQVDNWKKWFGFIKPHFAIKAQHNEVTRRLFHRLGLGYDCASEYEINSVLGVGCSPDKIIVAHPFKTYHSLSEVLRHRLLTVFDSIDEAEKIAEMWDRFQQDGRFIEKRLEDRVQFAEAEAEDSNCTEIRTGIVGEDEVLMEKPKVLIRIKPSKVAIKKAGWDLSTKFGVEWGQFEEVVQHCKLNNEQLDVKGLSFHVGLRASDAEPWVETIKFARECWHVLEKHGYNPTILNVGGGFKGHDKTKLTPEIGHTIQEAVKDSFGSLPDFPEVIAEPGTFMVGTSQNIAACVIGTKYQTSTHPHYYLSAGIYNGLLWHLIDPNYEAECIPLIVKGGKKHVLKTPRLWGVSCDSADDLGHRPLPELQYGDWVMYNEVGDYNMELCTTFNGFQHPQMYYCCEHRHIHIVRQIFESEFIFRDIETH